MGGLSLPKIKLPSRKSASVGKKKDKLCLGLDIGSHAIKICQLANTGKGLQLQVLGSARLPIGAVEDGILQEPEAVSKVISSLVKNLKIKDKKVAISISGYSVIVKKINLSVMDDADLEEYLKTEAGQYIPFDINDVFLDYEDLKTNTPDYERTDVMLVAAKKEVVNGYVEMLQAAGLQAVVVDVDCFALENIFEANFTMDDNVALVDIGASKMSINIIAGGTSVLARDVVIGSHQLTEQIQNRLGLGDDEAEALKVGTMPVTEYQKELEEIFVNTCTQWALEVKKAIDLYYTNQPDKILSRLVLSGGGSRVTGLDVFLSEEVGLPVEIFNPFAKMAAASKKIDPDYLRYMAPEMAIAAGLALRPPAF